MASSDQIRQYLAYWFQLGKPVLLHNRQAPNGQEVLLPRSVIQGDRYSSEFEAIWQRLQSCDARDAYLEGTIQTLGDLMSSSWEIAPCARCAMPVPVLDLGMRAPTCPCADLPGWPDTEVPAPRSPINSDELLQSIRNRLPQK